MFKKEFIDKILNSECTCLVSCNDKVFTSSKRGVAPILDFIDESSGILNGALVYDNIIGKAAAMLLQNNNVRGIFAAVISSYACDFLDEHNIPYEYISKVSFIENRTKNGMCPLENEVLELTDSNKAYGVIRARIKILMSK